MTRFIRITVSLFLLVAFGVGVATAQSVRQPITVTGQVFDAIDGKTIIDGASVRVKGSEKGIVTDSEGKFTIDAALGDTLEVILFGYGNTEVIVNDDVLNVFMTMNVWECPSATKGIVKDYNGKPIRGATVTLSPSGESTVTNKKGKFKFDTELRDKMIIVECPGYETFRGAISGNTFNIMLDNNLDNNKLSGVVLDEENDEPLVGATITIKGTNRGVATDVNGKFKISAQKGDVLEVSYIGYLKQTKKVTIKKPMKIKLKPNPNAIICQ